MALLEWATAVQGRYVQAPGGLGRQCVDLANLWLIACGAEPVHANAADWAAPGVVRGWTWTPNGPVNAPRPGAIVVWEANVPAHAIGPYGHIAVALAADSHVLITLDQDWPVGAPVALTIHDYRGVAGWHTPPG